MKPRTSAGSSSAGSSSKNVRYDLTTTELLGCGALAGAVGKTTLAPVDRVKLMYMVRKDSVFSLRGAARTARSIVASEAGLAGLWAGNGAAMLRVMPYSALTFTSFARFERGLQRTFGGEKSASTRFVAGAAAGASSTVVTYPLDLLRARMAAHWAGPARYRSVTEAVGSIVRHEGVLAFWGGLWPTLVGIVPYAGLSFGTYETLKYWVGRQFPGVDGPGGQPTMLRLTVGGVAGLVAGTATYPLHVLRRRMQVQTMQEAGAISLYQGGILAALRKIYLEEGVRNGLFKGVTLTWVKAPFSVAIAFTLNDWFKGALGGWWAIQTEAAAAEVAARREKQRIRGENASSVERSLAQRELVSAVDGGDGAEGADDYGNDAPPRLKLTALESLIAGGVAGAVAKTTIAPADRVKILFQVDTKRSFSLSAAVRTARTIQRNSGLSGLYRGNAAMMLRVVPYSGVSYYSFEVFESAIAGSRLSPQLSDIRTRFLAGAAAGATSTIATYPLDLLRARMAAHWATEPKYGSYRTAMSTIIKEEGARALLSGLWPTLVGIVPYAGLSFATYNTLKAYWVSKTQMPEGDMPTAVRLCSGGVAGLLAQSATYPLDVVRRRMQVQGLNAAGEPQAYTGVAQALRTIYAGEGVAGLYKGLTMNWVKGPVAVATSFVVNDLIKGWMKSRQARGRPAGAGWLYYFGL